MSELNCWHISDTHSMHLQLKEPDNIDLIIFSGDEANPKDKYQGEQETLNFLYWMGNLKAKYKVFVAGNHSSAIATKLLDFNKFNEYGIIYLEDSSVNIEGFNIYGSPWSPNFCNWHFMKDRSKLHDIWQEIPLDTDILITHTPPKTILDLSYDRKNILEYCGCQSLKKRVLEIQPLLHCFGHIHNCQDIINAGLLKLSEYKTVFSNGSVATDGKFSKGVTSNGNIIKIKKTI